MPILIDPILDQRRAHFSVPARDALLADTRRIVVVGARGWIGRTLLTLLHDTLDPGEFTRRVVCFGSADGEVELEDGVLVRQKALAGLSRLPAEPTLLLHLAFLTKDKVGAMAASEYVLANRALSARVDEALDAIGVDRLFLASSGAAAFVDDPEAAPDLRLYGELKLEDEARFAAWARRSPMTRRAAIGRIYSVSGPWMNKHETYALASFIHDALADRPIEVRAPFRVFRSYVAVRELLSLVLAALLTPYPDPVLSFSTGGEALELGDVAATVARLFNGKAIRRPVTSPKDNRYVGDAATWTRVLARFGITHLPLDEQVAETSVWLARQSETHPPVRAS